jgi:uncharacterized membrane protein
MLRRRHDYWPMPGPFLMALAAVATVCIALLVFGAISYAYRRIGLDQNWLIAALVGSILGSRINIPVARFPDRTRHEEREVVAFGVRYRVPTVTHTGTTVLAVNVGGALIPAALATYLTVHNHLWVPALLTSLAVGVIVHLIARPMPGVGIVVPTFVPPIVAALAAVLASTHAVAAVAYICGTMGTLFGADVSNIGKIRDLGAPVASIGGAGTFDGIFLTGVLAVILA